MGLLYNAFYNVDHVTINGAHLLTAGGLYNAQYVDWFTHGETLDIANYSASLPAGTGGYYNVASVQGLQDLLGFSESNAADNFRLTAGISLPPGFYVPYFAGSFDGNGKILSNLSLNVANSNLGFFGFLPSTNTEITGIALTNVQLTGSARIGGLAGLDLGAAITDSYVSGSVSSTGDIGSASALGGLVGDARGGSISNSYAAGTVDGGGIGFWVGGLVGSLESATVTNSYSKVDVSGTSAVGGLVGANYGTIHNSYSVGQVHASSTIVGGLAGTNYGSISNSFYDRTTNPGLTGLASYSGPLSDVAGVAWGLSTAQLQTPANFVSTTSANGSVNPGWDVSSSVAGNSVWFIYAGDAAPLLRSFMTPITVGGGAVTQPYNSIPFVGSMADLVYSMPPDLSHILGTLSATGAGAGAVNPGSYTYMPGGLYSDQQGYLISYASGTLTITQGPVPTPPSQPPSHAAAATTPNLSGIRTALQGILYAPAVGTQPQSLVAESTLAMVSGGAAAPGAQAGTDGSAGGATSVVTLPGGKAVAVRFDMSIGAAGTLEVRNGGILLPDDLVQAGP
jgi:hypothetical protein